MRRSSSFKAAGSLSVFAALSLMLVAAVLFTFLEAARVKTITCLAEMNTDSITESFFAAYNLPLWQKYHILGMEATGAGNQFSLINQEAMGEELSQCNLDPEAGIASGGSWNLYRMELVDLSFPEYRLLTDQKGSAYTAMVSSYMKENLLVETASKIYSQYETVQNLDQQAKEVENQRKDGQASLESLTESVKEEARTAPAPESGKKAQLEKEEASNAGASDRNNPMELVETMQKSGILSLLVENPSELSTQSIDPAKVVSGRTLQQGCMSGELDSDWYDRVLMGTYFTRYFSDYVSPAQGQALEYELEYIICGKRSDMENLKTVAGRLLGIREASNMAYLLTDVVKCEEALALATALAGVTVNPLIIGAVKYGILASWAFAESVMDVRALLQGEKIPILKSSDQWTTDLDGLAATAGSFGKAKECSQGLTYSQYLMCFLIVPSVSATAYRAMDLQEAYVQSIAGYENFQFDHLVMELMVNTVYQWNSVFLSLVSIGQVSKQRFTFTDSEIYTYRKAGV